MKKSYDPSQRMLAGYIDRLEQGYDAEGQGREFTFSVTGDYCDDGFIYMTGNVENSYTGLEDIPDEYRILGGGDDESELSTAGAGE